MKVKNNYMSHLGFGTARILPGETAELPREYGINHPVVKWYISRKWLEVVEERGVIGNPSQAVEESTNLNTGGAAEAKAVEKMNLEELKAHAAEIGLSVEDGDTRKSLIEKIKESQPSQ